MTSTVTPRPRAALFDMDRTLLRVETVSLYVKHQRRMGEATLWDAIKASYWLLQYTFGILDAPKVAEKVLVGLAGMPETVLAARCDDWFLEYVERHITDEGRRTVERHQKAGDVCAIVTAASPYAARPLGRILGIEHVVSSEFDVDGKGIFTGRVSPPLCIGTGKVTRAQALADRLGFSLDDAIFYTDSVQDLPLVERVGEAVCVNPDPRLGRIARKRGYRIERW
ncbi:MAG: HAD family hydrolase [Polyangiaceae bacterium]